MTLPEHYADAAPEPVSFNGERSGEDMPPRWQLSASALQSAPLSKWFGAVLGLGVGGYLWFATPDIGLEPSGTKLLGLISLTLIFWVFRTLPDYGVALVFAMAVILTKLESAPTVMGGFASTTWFMTLGVLGLGAAITGCGLFYRLSLHLVRLFPLSFYWQIIATGIMGVVVMALIPQQTARTVITSQMLINLSESLGYKTPSKASTGLFVASFLGLGQLGFLFLTGSTTSLIAWGLLPPDVREQFTWGYWFLAALPPTLVVIVIILAVTIFLYRPETQSKISYKMVQTQLDILGPMSHKEWISLIVLLFTVVGWLTAPYHGIDGAWIAIIAFAVLVNTSILDWGMMRKGIDWELLIHMGVTLSLPTLMKQAKIDQWLIDVISPLILPFMDSPVWFFIVIALLTYVLKLVFTSFLAVVTLCVTLLPLSIDVGMNPLDHRHDDPDRLGSLVFPVSSRLAYARLLHHRPQRFLLPAHVPDQSGLRPRLYRRVTVGDPLLAFLRLDELARHHGEQNPHRRRRTVQPRPTRTGVGRTRLCDGAGEQRRPSVAENRQSQSRASPARLSDARH